MIAGAENAFSQKSKAIVSEGGVVNLGGLEQTVEQISLRGGELRNGSLDGGAVEVLGS